jgi:hypothetical protein
VLGVDATIGQKDQRWLVVVLAEQVAAQIFKHCLRALDAIRHWES